jgi:hypothetical protein
MAWSVSSGEGGDFFKPQNGIYRLTFLGSEDAGMFDNRFKPGVQVEKVRFRYHIADYTTNAPVNDPETGEPAVVTPLLTKSVHRRSNAFQHFSALLGRDLADGESGEALVAESVGKTIIAQFGKGQNGNDGALLKVMPDIK